MDSRLVIPVEMGREVEIWHSAGPVIFYGYRIVRKGREVVSSEHPFSTVEAARKDAWHWLWQEAWSIVIVWGLFAVMAIAFLIALYFVWQLGEGLLK